MADPAEPTGSFREGVWDPYDFGTFNDRQVLDRGFRNAQNVADKYGSVAGFRSGAGPEVDRRMQQFYLNNLLLEGDQGTERVGLGFGQTQNATTNAINFGAQGGEIMQGGNLVTSDAIESAQGMLPQILADSRRSASAIDSAGERSARDVRTVGSRLMGGYAQAGTQGANQIIGAAAPPQTSVAAAQADAQLDQAQKNNLALAAQSSRGGNTALARRQALAANAAQQTEVANQSALLRAQEEAQIRDSQIAAADAAARLRLSAMGGASQAGLGSAEAAGGFRMSGTTGAANTLQSGQGLHQQSAQGIGQLGQDQARLGSNLAQWGIGTQLQGGQAMSAIGADQRDAARGYFQDMSLGQAGLDQDMLQWAKGSKDKRRAERRGAIASALTFGLAG